jgi:hypothetical protein
LSQFCLRIRNGKCCRSGSEFCIPFLLLFIYLFAIAEYWLGLLQYKYLSRYFRRVNRITFYCVFSDLRWVRSAFQICLCKCYINWEWAFSHRAYCIWTLKNARLFNYELFRLFMTQLHYKLILSSSYFALSCFLTLCHEKMILPLYTVHLEIVSKIIVKVFPMSIVGWKLFFWSFPQEVDVVMYCPSLVSWHCDYEKIFPMYWLSPENYFILSF